MTTMLQVVIWWGVAGWCIAMVAVGYIVDCHRNTKKLSTLRASA